MPLDRVSFRAPLAAAWLLSAIAVAAAGQGCGGGSHGSAASGPEAGTHDDGGKSDAGGDAGKPDGGADAGQNDAGKSDGGSPHDGGGSDSGPAVDGGHDGGTNHAPVAADQRLDTGEDVSVDITLGASDEDGDALTFTVVDQPAHGSLSGSAPDLSYTPNADFNGEDSFTFKASDGQLDSAPATVTISIAAVNDAPNAQDDALTVAEGGSATVLDGGETSLLANDSDVEGDSLTLSTTPVAAPSHGTLTLNADGTFSYTHDGSEGGSDSFSYSVCDDGSPSQCATATVAITVTPVNDAPMAVADSAVVEVGATVTTLEGGATSVLANDSDPEQGTLTATTTPVTAPSHGTLMLNADGSFSYTHDGGSDTEDSFVYQVCDDDASPLCAMATVSLSIVPVNAAPVLGDDNLSVTQGGTATLLAGGVASLLANDSPGDSGQSLQVSTTPAGAPAHGTLTLNADGTFSYTHDGSSGGSDSFMYEACDDGIPAKCATATVAVAVAASNHAPTPMADSLTVLEGGTATMLDGGATSLLANDTDPDGNNLSAALGPLVAPSHGTLAILSDGSFSYIHDGSETTSDSFSYVVCDDGTPSLCASASVTIAVTPVNDPPSAGTDSFSTVGNTLLVAPNTAPSILANDSDVEGNGFAITSYDATSAEGGSVVLDMADGSFNYLPPAGFKGTDSFTYTVTDDGSPAASGVGTVQIEVVDMVWYVDNTGSGGSGRSTEPFADLASAQAASSAGDVIFVHTGSGPYAGGIALKDGQQLLGEGAGLAVMPNAMIAAGSAPEITNAGGDAVTLAAGNLIRGLSVNGPSGAAFAGSGIGGATVISDVAIGAAGGAAVAITGTGSLELANAGAISAQSGLLLDGLNAVTVADSGISISASGGPALEISSVGSLELTFDALDSSNSARSGVKLDGVGGSLVVKNGTTVSSPQADGIAVHGATGSASFDFGSCHVQDAGKNAGDGYAFDSNPSAAISLGIAVDPSTAHGRGLFASNSGTLTITSVPSSISAVGGAAIDLRDTAGKFNASSKWHFVGLLSTGSSGSGVNLENLPDPVEIVGTTGVINAAAEAIRIQGVSGDLFLGNTQIDSRQQGGVAIDGVTSSSVIFATVSIDNINGATENAFEVGNSSAAVRVAALNVQDAVTALSLHDNTGSFTLHSQGGAPGNGGTISGSGGDAVVLANVQNVTFDDLIVTDSAGHGIQASAADGLVFRNGEIDKAGDAAGENALNLADVSGSVLIKDSVLSEMSGTGIDLVNTASSATLELDNVELSNNDAGTSCAGGPCGGSGLRVRSAGSLGVTVHNGCLFDHLDADGIDFATTAQDADMQVTVKDSSFTHGSLGQSAIYSDPQGGTLVYLIDGNTMSDWGGDVISSAIAADGLSVTGTISNNSISANNGGGAQGIRIFGNANPATNTYSGIVLVDANVIGQTNGQGIWVENGNASSTDGRLDVTVTGNQIDTTGSNALLLHSRDGTLLCAHVQDNVASNTAADPYALTQSDSSSFELEGTQATAQAEIEMTNTGTPVTVTRMPAIVTPGTCLLPP